MHWRSLLLGSELYRACSNESGDWDRFYWQYMESRDTSQWESPERLTEREVRRLLLFINQLGTRSQFDSEKVGRAYVGLFPVLQDLKRMNLYDLGLSQPLAEHGTVSEAIRDVFDTVATCGARYYSTGASKILHTWLPDLCVMWDAAIAAGYGIYDRRHGEEYSTKFLPRVSVQAVEALDSYIAEYGGTRAEAAAAISKRAEGRVLTKLVDEYNYVKYTRSCNKLWFG